MSVSTFNFTAMCGIYPIYSNGFDASTLMGWSYVKPIIVFGIIPLVLAFISIIACFCACCVCCCNSYHRYDKKNKVL